MGVVYEARQVSLNRCVAVLVEVIPGSAGQELADARLPVQRGIGPSRQLLMPPEPRRASQSASPIAAHPPRAIQW
jgi:hypothetical protein